MEDMTRLGKLSTWLRAKAGDPDDPLWQAFGPDLLKQSVRPDVQEQVSREPREMMRRPGTMVRSFELIAPFSLFATAPL